MSTERDHDPNHINSACRTLATKITALVHEHASGSVSDVQFVKQLSEYALRGHEIIAPRHEPNIPLTDKQRHSAMRDWRGFAYDTAMIQWCEAHDVVLPGRLQWRWMPEDQQKVGAVEGLPGTRGWPRVTNGIECLIEQEGGKVFVGHLDWFKADTLEKAYARRAKNSKTRKSLKNVAKEVKANGKSMKLDDLLKLLQ